MRTIGRPGKKKTYVHCLRIEVPGSFMRRCLRTELRSELYAKGALCGCTMLSFNVPAKERHFHLL